MVGEECEADALRSLGEGGQIASADSAVRKGTAGMPAGLPIFAQSARFLKHPKPVMHESLYII
ncbi:MAG: hypothetical protein NC930_01265 [Candidatus Omnitrophica bacterium]|nr:hypothetical protein [Candidatus Omnitrophota bacterium]